jgi:hypothetical protein
MTRNKDEFKLISEIMGRHGGIVSSAYPENRGETAAGYLVHVIKMEDNPKEKKGVTNSHGPGIAWDFIDIADAKGGLELKYLKQAFYVREKKNEQYTFRGIYEVDTACSAANKVTHRRIKREIDEEAAEWRIVRLF